jgi:NitT/TauT family transport system substrate-binding protein
MKTRLGLRSVAVGVGATLAVLSAGACGSSSDSSDAATTTTATAVTTASTATTGATANSAPTTAAAEPTSTAPLEVQKIRVTTIVGALLGLPQVVAEAKGFYKAAGLEVETVPVNSGPAGAQALLAGAADMMLNSPEFLLLAGEQGQAMKLVVGNTVSAVTTLVARKGWPLPNAGKYPDAVKDLKGAKIGVTALGSVNENHVRLMLKDAGLDPDKDVTIIATGAVNTSLPALQAGQIDAWMGFEPGTTLALGSTGIATTVVDLRADQAPPLIHNTVPNGYAATDSYIAKNHDTVVRFVDAMEQAHKWMADAANADELNQIVAKNFPVDAAIIPQLIKDNLATFGATIPEANIENSISIMKQFGLIKGTPKYSDIVATEFVPTS